MIRKYDPDTKAAVMASLLQGQSVSSAAREYDIPKGTVSGWKRQANGVVKKSTQKREEIGELLLSYLRANLESLTVQAEFFKNEDWLAKQTASDLAVLHGVTTDKAIRLLEAMSNVNSSD